MQRKYLIGLMSGLALVLLSSGFKSLAFETRKQSLQGDYTTIVRFGDGFVAATQTGRIDWISGKGEITKSKNLSALKLNSLLVVDKQIFASDDKGTIWIGNDSDAFKKIDSGIDTKINSLAFFNGKVIAAADEGELAIGNVDGEFESIELNLIGNIVSLSANSTDCYGVTDQGEIIRSKDGIKWDVFDFNKTYKGFYNACRFTKVLATDTQISIIGGQDDGLPVMFYSSLGTVWTQRNLVYTENNGASPLFSDKLNDLFYDEAFDQLILIGNHGKMMIIPSCSHCNKLFEIGEANLNAIAGNEHTLIVVGEGAFLKTERIDNF
jgi:hypothetical protein